MDTGFQGKPELAAKDAPLFHGDKTSNAKTLGLDGGSDRERELDSYMHPAAELEASRDIQEMKSNEEVGIELAISNLQVSELPS